MFDKLTPMGALAIIGTSFSHSRLRRNRTVAAVLHNSTGAALPIQCISVVSAAGGHVRANPFIV